MVQMHESYQKGHESDEGAAVPLSLIVESMSLFARLALFARVSILLIN